MLALSDSQIQKVAETIDQAEITFSHLRDDLIDHVCCEIESIMEEGLDFQLAFGKAKKSFGIKDLQRVQEHTLLLIDKQYRTMKKTMKISGIISTSLLMISALFKINHWPFASILMILGFAILCFLFLPSANIVMHKENKDRRLIYLYITGFLGSFGFFMGILFKLMHWPLTNILLVSGISVLALLFLPGLLIYLIRQSKNSAEKTTFAIGVGAGIIYLIGFLFKMMHWPGATILLISGVFLLVFVFLPLYTFQKYKDFEHIKGSFIYLVTAITWFILFSALISINVSKTLVTELVETNITINRNLSGIISQNEQLLKEARNKTDINVILKIDSISRDLCNYMDALMVEMVKVSGQAEIPGVIEHNQVAASKLSELTTIDSPSMVLFGNGSNSKASELKNKMDYYRDEMMSIINEDAKCKEKLTVLLSTKFPESSEENVSWEDFYFKRSSLIGTLNILSVLKRNILLAEQEAITYWIQ